MNKLTPYLILLALLLSSRAARSQQQELYVCRADSCDAFATRHIGAVNFVDGFLVVGSRWAYSVGRIDSIVLRRPTLAVIDRGWRGDLSEGDSRYDDNIYDTTLADAYHVSYRFTAHDGLCVQAMCEVTFATEELMQRFTVCYTLEATSNNDPYIYVKETLTGPRKFELWTMGNPMLPAGLLFIVDDQAPSEKARLEADLTSLLAGRPMTEVRQIIEAWLYAPAIQVDNPDYQSIPINNSSSACLFGGTGVRRYGGTRIEMRTKKNNKNNNSKR